MAVSNKELLHNIKADFELAKRLTDEEEGRIIMQIRALLPPVPCLTGCSQCCENVGSSGERFFSRWEWAQIHDKRRFPEKGPCPYLVGTKCDIYHDRPLICRVFGTTQGTLLSCKKGCVPERPVPLDLYKSIERMRYIFMLRALPSKRRKAALKSIIKDIKSGGPSNQNVRSYMEMWK